MSGEEVQPLVAIRKTWEQDGFGELRHVLFFDGTRGVQTTAGEMIVQDLGHAYFYGPTKSGRGVLLSVWDKEMRNTRPIVVFLRNGRPAKVVMFPWVARPPLSWITRVPA